MRTASFTWFMLLMNSLVDSGDTDTNILTSFLVFLVFFFFFFALEALIVLYTGPFKPVFITPVHIYIWTALKLFCNNYS